MPRDIAACTAILCQLARDADANARARVSCDRVESIPVTRIIGFTIQPTTTTDTAAATRKLLCGSTRFKEEKSQKGLRLDCWAGGGGGVGGLIEIFVLTEFLAVGVWCASFFRAGEFFLLWFRGN